jgi:hypothetical protein
MCNFMPLLPITLKVMKEKRQNFQFWQQFMGIIFNGKLNVSILT